MDVLTAWAAGSVTGLVRPGNEDAAYAGRWLHAVADGMGGHVAGEIASATAITTLADWDTETEPDDLADTLAQAVTAADAAIRQRTEQDHALRTMSTTLTAMLWSGHAYALAHIGDSRAYQLRGGQMRQLTTDHSYANLVSGTTPDLLAPVMSRFLDGRGDRSPDLLLQQARPGDRYLLCSDGLTSVVPAEAIRDALTAVDGRNEVVRQLTALAEAAGGPDNITVIVVDVLGNKALTGAASPNLLGAAADVALR